MFGFKGSAGNQKNTTSDLAEGRLPSSVTERLKRVTTGSLPSTSDLSVNEFHYLQRFGIRPLSLVMGSSVYRYVNPVAGYVDHIPPLPGSYHLNNFNRDVLSAHESALERLNGEAQALNADAVVGMTLHRREIDNGVTELMYLGTAVAFAAGTGANKYGVLSSFLPAQDFCALLANGYLPVRVVVGSSLILYIPDYYEHTLLEGGQAAFPQIFTGAFNTNQEIKGLSNACAEVYQNLRRQYNLLLDQEVPGHAVMGVNVSFGREEYSVGIPSYDFFPGSMSNECETVGSFLLTGTLTGTLVARVDRERQCPPVLPVLWLNG
ncbi:MAG TPA: heavy metal-binding domain-containing protein [Spirochaetia bacterium]|nr:heavy metal-binding domain-containing protein [Spirochaetia bacterium]